MSAPIDTVRTVDTAQIRTRSPAVTRFEQAVAQVSRIDRLVSPALAQSRESSAAASLMAPTNQTQAKLERLQSQMRRTGDARLAPLIAEQMQEYDYRSTLAAKALGKVGASIKEVATAA